MNGILIDSNVLVYAHDRSEPAKQRQAREVLDRLTDRPDAHVSAQVLAETFRVLTVRLPACLSIEEAESQINAVRRIWSVLPINEAVVLEAIRGVRMHQMNYWDAQVWAVAALNQLSSVLTEDLPSAVQLESVTYINPFADGFDLNVLN